MNNRATAIQNIDVASWNLKPNTQLCDTQYKSIEAVRMPPRAIHETLLFDALTNKEHARLTIIWKRQEHPEHLKNEGVWGLWHSHKVAILPARKPENQNSIWISSSTGSPGHGIPMKMCAACNILERRSPKFKTISRELSYRIVRWKTLKNLPNQSVATWRCSTDAFSEKNPWKWLYSIC